jgi:RNA polymerase sigma-70 factor (ECF subfamily)
MKAHSVAAPQQPAERPDAEVLASIANGDLRSLAEIYDRYHRDVRRVLGRLEYGSAHVDDLIQATFLTLPKAAISYDGRPCCRSWLYGIALRIASRHRRSFERFRRMLLAMGDSQRSMPDDPEMELCRREDFRRFKRAFERLKPKKRDVFVLIELEGLSTEDAAQALSIPAATVRSRLFHAKHELRTAITRGTP